MIKLQNNVWHRLVQQIPRLPHALLLHGPVGVGKLGLAERFAQLLLCEAGEGRSEPCGKCEACRWFAAGSHPDVRFVEPEAIARSLPEAEPEEKGAPKRKPSIEIRIDQVRALTDFLNVGSHRGRRRVAIVHPAEHMNTVTANALLKGLEEPPGNAMFLLVSHRPSRLLPTIRSRCVPVPVPLPQPAAARTWLQAQGVREPDRWLAYAGGSPRQALEFSTGELGERLAAILTALKSGEFAALAALDTREEVELLVDALQKHALDEVLAASGAPRRYGVGPAGPAGDARQWLAYARALGRSRGLARHPLNPRLFVADLLAGRPSVQSS